MVSYDVTFQLDQLEAGLKPGMSATAEVVVKQAEGVNVPTSAISAGSVTVMRGGKQVRQRVVTRPRGQQLDDHPQRPEGGRKGRAAVASTSSASSRTSTPAAAGVGTVARRGGGGGGFGGGGGAAAFFRGGG